MIVFIIPNLVNANAASTLENAASTLHRCGAHILLCDKLREQFSHLAADFLPEQEAFQKCDVIVTVGGDGTILHTARKSLGFDKPLLGINVGRLGFLATVEAYEMEKLERLARGEFSYDRRTLLAVSTEGRPELSQTALNDVMISKNISTQTVDIAVYCDDILANHFRGDGVVIATPTGSTAYSLSAGGPVLDAHIAGLVVTPVCAHGLHSPPMVLSAQRRLRILASAAYGAPNPLISCDGGKPWEIAPGQAVSIALSEQSISLVCFNEADQFEAIDKKLRKL